MENKFRVTAFKVDENFVTATVVGEDTETDMLIDRSKIDNWITEGTRIIETYIGDKEITIHIDEYWADSSINNEPHITDIQNYLERDESSKIRVIEELRKEIILQCVRNMCGQFTPVQELNIK